MSAYHADLDGVARGRLAALAEEVGAEPARIATLFPAVARRVARGPADPADPDGLLTPRREDQARAALLASAAAAWRARGEPGRLPAEVTALYRFGDADEKRAVLRALPDLDAELGQAGLPLIADALRTNDPRLIAAALGPYAARRLDSAAWRQGVLKCLFTGVPLAAVAGLDERADAELTRMVRDYARERQAAGRPVPDDARLLLERYGEPPVPEHPEQ